MKKFMKKLTGKTPKAEPGPPPGAELQHLELPAPPAYTPPPPTVSNGSMRRPRRPRETVDLNYADYAPFAPQPQPLAPAPAPGPSLDYERQRQLEQDIELARQLAAQEMAPQLAAAYPAPPQQQPYFPPPLQQQPYFQPLPPPPSEPPQPTEAEREAAFQAELDAVLAESVLQADYDNVLRDIKLWVLDLTGALGDVAAAQQAAQRKRAEVDAQMAAANPADEAGWEQIMWLSQSHAEVEARLQELAWRLKPIDNAVNSLRDLDAYIRADQPPVQAVRDSLDRIIAKLLDELNSMGFAFHHPTTRFGRQEGEGPSRAADREVRAGDPLRDLVHSLIEETKRMTPPPPRPRSAEPLVELESDGEQGHAEAEAGPEEEEAEEEPVETTAASTPEEPAPASPPPAEPLPEPSAPEVPQTPEPSCESPPKPAPPPVVGRPSPRPAGSDGWATPPRAPTPGRDRASASPGTHRSSSKTPASGEQPRRPRSGSKPLPGDSIKRLPRVVALHAELQKGVVAEAVGWHLTKGAVPRRGQSNPTGYPGAFQSGGEAAPKFTPALFPTRLPPSSSQKHGAEVGSSQESLREDQPAAGSLAPGDLAQAAAEVVAFKPATLQQAADFMAELQARGATGSTGGAGWPQEKWAVLWEAVEVHNTLKGMTAELNLWHVDSGAGTVAESQRLASFIDRATKEAGRVTYEHDPLRQRMKRHGVPWDPTLLADIRWAAQHAAAELMAHALEEARALSKAKKWHAHALLQPLGHAAMGAFKVHQFCGGLNNACTALFDQLQEVTIHHARMIDHQWLRNTKWA